MTPDVGDAVPDFSLSDPVTGKTWTRADLDGRDAMIVFLRGTWCPYCREQLAVLSERRALLEQAGVQVLAISCQGADALRRFAMQTPLGFPLLADPNRRAARAFGVHYWLRWDGFHLAHPSLFIVGADGTVLFRHIGRTMRDLPVALLIEKFLGFLEAAGAAPEATTKRSGLE